MKNFPFTAAALFVVLMFLIVGNADLRPCETEDSKWCYWDAATRGNGEGTSFIALGGN